MSGAALIHGFSGVVTVTRYGDNRQVVILTLSDDFVQSNVVEMKIDGVALPQVIWAGSHAETMSDLAMAMSLMPTIETASVTGSREITIVGAHAGNQVLIQNIVISGGVSHPVAATAVISGGYIDGIYHASTSTSFQTEMSIQPATDKEIQKLPEGDRTKRIIKAYSPVILRTAEQRLGSKADRVSYDRTLFEVFSVQDWFHTDLNHCKVILVEVNP